MSGRAVVHFLCGAWLEPDVERCDATLFLPLGYDGHYPSYVEPADWHIRLGTTAADTLVRCPQHCEWTAMGTTPAGTAYPLPGGEWIDAP